MVFESGLISGNENECLPCNENENVDYHVELGNSYLEAKATSKLGLKRH